MKKKSKSRSLQKRYKYSHDTKDSGIRDIGIMDWSKVDDDVEFFHPVEGRNKIIIVPYWIKSEKHPLVVGGNYEIGEMDYMMDVWEHRMVGPAETNEVCLKRTYGKPCPICEKASEYKDMGKQKEYEALRPSRRVYYNVIDMKDPDRKLKVFSTSYFLFEKELIDEAGSSEDGEFVDFADPENGKIISFRASKVKKGGFEYMEFRSFRFIDRDEELDEDLVDRAISFDEIMRVYDYKTLEEVFYGMNGEEDEDEEEEENEEEREREKKKENKKKSKKRELEKVEKDEKEDENEDEEEEEEEESKIKSNKEKSKSKNKCPYGHKFGDDWDEYDDCNDCEIWDECAEA